MDIKPVRLLSIIIPCYNEENTIGVIVEEIMATDIGKTKKEIIIVDDCSTDNSFEIIEKLQKKYTEVKGYKQDYNQGKGAALKLGFSKSIGDVVIVQDADREYDPKDYLKMLQLFRDDRADVVFGSRFSGGSPKRMVYLANKIANRFMSSLSAILSGLYLSDIHTCYIMFSGQWIRENSKDLKSKRFGFNPEIVAKIASQKNNLRICEIGVSYFGRTKAEGKKIGLKDGLEAVYEIIKYNIF